MQSHFFTIKVALHLRWLTSERWLYTKCEWPSGLYILRQVTEVKLGRVRSDSGWVTTET